MDWLILLLLAPAIVVPIVLLSGFSGCSSFTEEAPKPTPAPPPPTPGAPSDLAATLQPPKTVRVSWQDKAFGMWKFQINRAEGGKGFSLLKDDLNATAGTGQSYLDAGLEGTTYFYAVNGKDPVSGALYPGPAAVGATTLPDPPTELKAIPFENEIHLQWNNASAAATGFFIERPPFSSTVPVATANPQRYPTVGLPPLTPFVFSVRSVVTGHLNTPVYSDPPSTVSTATAKPVFSFSAFAANESLGGFCIVQRLGIAVLQNSGSKVSIKLRGPTTGDVLLTNVTLSRAIEGAGTNPSDSVGTIVLVGSNVLVPRNGFVALGPVDFALDNTHPHIVAFDIAPDTPPPMATIWPVPTGPTALNTLMYRKKPLLPEATKASRPGYTSMSRVALIEQIAVS
jgi:hypothetical protein